MRLIAWLRKTGRESIEGIRAAVDILLWGQAYPRTVDLAQLRAMKRDATREG